jgi:putative oxidoreductase
MTEAGPSVGLLIYRLIFGGFMLVGHGWGKLMTFGENASGFPDPLGIGSTASLAGAVTSEVLFAGLVVVGLATRVAVIPLIFTMAVAAFVIHGEGPLWLPGAGAKEPALLYLAAYVILLFTGAGRFSLDHALLQRRKDPTK